MQHQEVGQPGSYSHGILQLQKLVNGLGCSVTIEPTSEMSVAGTCDYRNAKITIFEPIAKYALFTLAHESGHWLSYLVWPTQDFGKFERETLAMHLGWWLLKSIGFDIGGDEWMDFHSDEIGWLDTALTVW